MDLEILEVHNLELPLRTSQEIFEFYDKSDALHQEISICCESSGRTIAPVPEPDPPTRAAWADRIAVYAVEARKLGWLTSDKQVARIKALLEKTRTDRNLLNPVNELDTYIRYEDKAGRLRPEADAVIRMNAWHMVRALGGSGENR
jgi:hypothetical protein